MRRFLTPITRKTKALWVHSPSRTDTNSLWLEVMGRLKPGVSTRRAAAELNAIFVPDVTSGSKPVYHANDAPRLNLLSAAAGLSTLRTRYSRPLTVLMTAVGLVLLLACANVAGLMLARSSAREHEIALRNALGAGRWRIVRQLLAESLLLAVAGGALGILFAAAVAKSLAASIAREWYFPIRIDVAIDWYVVGFTLLVSLAVGVLFGLAPALRAARVDIGPTLKIGGYSDAVPSQTSRLGNILVLTQVAISVLVLVGAGLLGRSLLSLQTTDFGFNIDNLLLFQVNMRASGISRLNDPRFNRLNRELRNRFSALPGVVSATYSMIPPLVGNSFEGEFNRPDAPASSAISADVLNVGPRFFETLGIPLLDGRTFKNDDFESPGGLKPVVVNQRFATKMFGHENPLGRIFAQDHLLQVQVIGLVKDGKYERIREGARPTVCALDEFGSPTYELRTHGDPKALISMVHDAAAQVNPDFLVLHTMTQTEQIEKTTYQERLVATLSMFFGVLALALACLGLYGLAAYRVVQRTHEIGVRIALGAQRLQILKLIIVPVLSLTLMGIVIGLGVAAGLTRYLESLLYGVRPSDPLTFVGIALVLAVVAAGACFVPARTAIQLDPMVALRHE
jgi:predicted permease